MFNKNKSEQDVQIDFQVFRRSKIPGTTELEVLGSIHSIFDFLEREACMEISEIKWLSGPAKKISYQYTYRYT